MKSAFSTDRNLNNYYKGMFRPKAVYASNWGKRKYFRGAKANLPLHYSDSIFKKLIEPLKSQNKSPKVFFAGEAFDS